MDWMHLGTWLDELTDVELPALELKEAETLGDILSRLNLNAVTQTVEAQ
jgi:hypothetical protein